jgi:starvation-inducible DNA-binding protein
MDADGRTGQSLPDREDHVDHHQITARPGVRFLRPGGETHAAHWNVTGPGFFELHAAFGTQYLALFEAADELAERIRALGDKAPTGIHALAKCGTLDDIESDEGRALAKALADDHRALAKACGKALRVVQEADDEATADLLITRIEDHDKTAWMLSAYTGR